MHNESQLSESISVLAQAVCGLTEQLKHDGQNKMILLRIADKLEKIMSAIQHSGGTGKEDQDLLDGLLKRSERIVLKLEQLDSVSK